jgi:hypothetical protein
MKHKYGSDFIVFATIVFVVVFFLFLLIYPSVAHEDDELAFSCKAGGLMKECYEEVLRMDKHPVPAGFYASAGTFILLNATCISPNATFAFHAPFLMIPFRTSIDPDYTDVAFSEDSWMSKIGVLFFQGETGKERFYKFLATQYPQLVDYLKQVNALRSINQYFQLSGEEMSKLIQIPPCKD